MDTISFSDFKKIKIRTGKVLEVSVHPHADKLYILKVDLGDKQIQLVAGLRLVYKEEEILGKNIVVLENLEPKTLRGVESQGMLLAASDGDNLSLLVPEREVRPGAEVR